MRALLDAGVEPLRLRLEAVLASDPALAEIGLAVVAVRLNNLAPSSELERALQTPTFEALQQKADEAMFERRALAVDKERAITENELANKIEIARREKQLIAEETANARDRASGLAEAQQIEAEAEAERIRAVESAKAEAEQAHITVYRDLPPAVLLGLAARELAGKLDTIEHLNVTPDLLAAFAARVPQARPPPRPRSTEAAAMGIVAPRAVFVTRETDYELLLARHATREQARFFLETRGQKLADLEQRHDRFQAVLREARGQVPDEWRQALVRRADFDRFLFAPDDIVVAIGQDGLVANVAKYLSGQPVLGVNPAPDLYDGVLVRLPLGRLAAVLPAVAQRDVAIERADHGRGLARQWRPAGRAQRDLHRPPQPPVGALQHRRRVGPRGAFLERRDRRDRHRRDRLGALDHARDRRPISRSAPQERGDRLSCPRALSEHRHRHLITRGQDRGRAART